MAVTMRTRRLLVLGTLLLVGTPVALLGAGYAPSLRPALRQVPPYWRAETAAMARMDRWGRVAYVDAMWLPVQELHAMGDRAPAPDWGPWTALPAERRYTALHRPTYRNKRLQGFLHLTIGAPLLLLLVLFFFLGLGGKLGKVKMTTSQGSARWATRAELRRRLRVRKNKESLVLGLSADGELLALGPKDIDRHVLVVGPPGSGKSSGFIAPNILRHTGPESLVIVDPKSELVGLCYAHLAKHYDVWIVNFMSPERSMGYNPLAYVVDQLSAEAFAESWISNTGKSQSDPFWDNAAKTMIVASSLHLNALYAAEGGATLTHLHAFLSTISADRVFEALSGSPSLEARAASVAFLENVRKNDKMEGSIFAELAPRFTILADPRVAACTSRHEVDFRALADKGRDRPVALFLAIERTMAPLLKPLSACFFEQMFKELIQVADANVEHGGVLPRRVRAYIDEFGNLGAIPDMPRWITTVRSAGMGLIMAVQTYAQVEATYEKKGSDVILPGCGTHIALATTALDDAKKFSEMAGEATVITNSASKSLKRAQMRAKEGGESQGESKRSLITPYEVTRMEEDMMLALVGNMHPMKVRQQRFYKVKILLKRSRAPYLGNKVPTGGPLRPVALARPEVDMSPAPAVGPGAPDPSVVADPDPPADISSEDIDALLRETFGEDPFVGFLLGDEAGSPSPLPASGPAPALPRRPVPAPSPAFGDGDDGAGDGEPGYPPDDDFPAYPAYPAAAASPARASAPVSADDRVPVGAGVRGRAGIDTSRKPAAAPVPVPSWSAGGPAPAVAPAPAARVDWRSYAPLGGN